MTQRSNTQHHEQDDAPQYAVAVFRTCSQSLWGLTPAEYLEVQRQLIRRRAQHDRRIIVAEFIQDMDQPEPAGTRLWERIEDFQRAADAPVQYVVSGLSEAEPIVLFDIVEH